MFRLVSIPNSTLWRTFPRRLSWRTSRVREYSVEFAGCQGEEDLNEEAEYIPGGLQMEVGLMADTHDNLEATEKQSISLTRRKSITFSTPGIWFLPLW